MNPQLPFLILKLIMQVIFLLLILGFIAYLLFAPVPPLT